MGIGNNLYLIGTKCSLEELSNEVSLVNSFSGNSYPAYFSFWDKVIIIEYNRDTKEYFTKEFGLQIEEPVKKFQTESELFSYMDDENITFISDENVLGNIFQSYTAAYLELIRWAADVAYTKNKLNDLLEG